MKAAEDRISAARKDMKSVAGGDGSPTSKRPSTATSATKATTPKSGNPTVLEGDLLKKADHGIIKGLSSPWQTRQVAIYADGLVEYFKKGQALHNKLVKVYAVTRIDSWIDVTAAVEEDGGKMRQRMFKFRAKTDQQATRWEAGFNEAKETRKDLDIEVSTGAPLSFSPANRETATSSAGGSAFEVPCKRSVLRLEDVRGDGEVSATGPLTVNLADDEIGDEDLDKLIGKIPAGLTHLRLYLPDGQQPSAEKVAACITAAGPSLTELLLSMPGGVSSDDACSKLTEVMSRDMTALSVDFSFANSTDDFPAFLAALPAGLSELDLNLDKWDLGAEGAEKLGAKLQDLAPTLSRVRLGLRGCGIEQAGVESLKALRSCSGLKGLHLLLEENGLDSEDAIKAVQGLLPPPTEIQLRECVVDVSGNQMGGSPCLELLKAMEAQAPTLQEFGFKIKYEQLDNAFMECLAKTVKACTNATSLHLEMEGTERGVENLQLLQAIPANVKTLRLGFKRCEISVALGGLVDIAKTAKSLNALELHVGENFLKNESVTEIAKAVSQMKALSYLNVMVGNNSFGVPGAQALLDVTSKMKALETCQVEGGADLEDGVQELIDKMNH